MISSGKLNNYKVTFLHPSYFIVAKASQTKVTKTTHAEKDGDNVRAS